jgi:hypothetical protein
VAADARGAQSLGVFQAIFFFVEEHDIRRQLDDARDLGVLRPAYLFNRVYGSGRVHAKLRAPDE